MVIILVPNLDKNFVVNSNFVIGPNQKKITKESVFVGESAVQKETALFVLGHGWRDVLPKQIIDFWYYQ